MARCRAHVHDIPSPCARPGQLHPRLCPDAVCMSGRGRRCRTARPRVLSALPPMHVCTPCSHQGAWERLSAPWPHVFPKPSMLSCLPGLGRREAAPRSALRMQASTEQPAAVQCMGMAWGAQGSLTSSCTSVPGGLGACAGQHQQSIAGGMAASLHMVLHKATAAA